MDYEALAQEFITTQIQMGKRKNQKRFNESIHGEAFALYYISSHTGSAVPGDIREAMGLSSARIAAALNSLEHKELITRRIDPQDRRRILIDITEKGRGEVDRRKKELLRVTTGMLSALGEHDAPELVRIMKRVAQLMPETPRDKE